MASTGNPVWIDIYFPDPEPCETFYGTLFGWTFEDQGPELGNYRMIRSADGRIIGGASPGMPDNEDVPTDWTVHLSTDDLAKAVNRTTASGGRILFDPMQIGELGRVAIVAAPSGASLGIWQAESFDGFEQPLTDGTPVWFEEMSTSFEADRDFYASVFGWENQMMEGGLAYATNWPQDAATAGLCDASEIFPSGTEPYWRIYFQVADVDAAMEQVTTLGGTVLDGADDSPFGRLATVADPHGNAFQIIMPPAR
ncbi:VOC family protein [Zhihengliuella halotolerans]|uniref:VOC family protein n=1 Tax=Zhihengliuella halotolerans TaxID=370736 RepID=UPI000C805EA0|nr:VOC family protein [Zhihengliuella halotolerans]